MLYSMAMVRMVNGVCDASQKGKSAMSVMSIARRHGLPPMLVDLRHAATHGDLPSLSALQTAAGEAIDWLLARYWTRQDAAAVRGSDKMHGTAKRELLKFLDGFRTAKTAALKQQVERSGSLPPPSPRTSKADKMMAPLVQVSDWRAPHFVPLPCRCLPNRCLPAQRCLEVTTKMHSSAEYCIEDTLIPSFESDPIHPRAVFSGTVK